MKTLDTLIEDIYGLFNEYPLTIKEEYLSGMSGEIASVISRRLTEEKTKGTLRMSNIGRPERQLWYDINGLEPGYEPEPLRPNTNLLFMFGDVWEAILLYLAKQAGHSVTGEQHEVTLGGIVGHNDAIIDGVLVDVKSASPHGFRKFEENKVHEDDPFGYMEQLAAYCKAHGEIDGAFLAVHKVTGKLALARYSWEELSQYKIEQRIEYVKEVVADKETVPEKCYQPEPQNPPSKTDNGNRVLAVGCRYCAYKDYCWRDANDGLGLRTFIYSHGPVNFTHVAKEPTRVQEITL